MSASDRCTLIITVLAIRWIWTRPAAVCRTHKIIIVGITKILGGIGKAIGSIGKDISDSFKAFFGIGSGDEVTQPFFNIAKKIGEAIGKIGEWISNAVKSLSFDKILGLLNTGLLGGFVLIIKKFFDRLSEIGERKGILAPIKEILDGVKGSLEAWQSSLKAGTLLKIAGAIAILAAALIALSFVDPENLAVSLGAITVALGELMGALAIIQKIAGKGKLKGTSTLITMTLSLLIVASAIKKLASLGWEELARGLSGMVVALGALVGAMALIQKIAGKGKLKGTATLLGMALALVMVGNIVTKLAELPIESSLGAAESLSILLLSLSAACAVASKVGGIAPSALLSVAIMAAIIAALGSVLYALSGLPIESTLTTATSLSIMLLSLSAACGILALVGSTGPAGFVGIGVLATLIAGIGGLIVGIGALVTQFPVLEQFLNKGIPILEQIGNAIGSFFGNIIGGFIGGMSTGMEQVGTSLSNFMANLQPFLEGAKGIDSSVTEGVKNLAQTLLILTGVNIAESFASWLTGGSSVSDFATQLVPLGTALTAFSDSISGLTPEAAEKIKMAADAAKALTSFASAIPNQGGMASWFAGDNSLISFAQQLKPFGEALADFAASTVNIDGSVVERINQISNAAKALTSFASTIPNQGGMASWFAGDNSLISFAQQLKPFGEALADFASTTASVTPESISAPIQALVDALNSLSQLDTSGINESAANLVSGFSEAIESNGPQVSNAGSNLGESLASGLRNSEGSVAAAGSSVAASGADGARGQAGIYSPMGQLFGNNMASGLIGFGPAMSEAASSAAASGASGASGQSGAYSGAGAILGSNLAYGLQGFSGALSAAGASAAGAGASGARGQSGTFNSTGGMLGQTLASGLLGGSGAASSAGASLGQAGASGASSQSGAFSSAGSNMAAGLAAGIRSGVSSVISAAVNLAQSALQAAKNALGIKSPSRAFIALGNYIGEGLAIGIRDSASQAVSESEGMAQRVAEVAGKSIEDIEDWISTEKHFDNLGLEEELAIWNAVIDKYAEGTEERIKAEKNAYGIYKQLHENNFQNSKDWIDREKEYHRLSLDEEIAAWERMQARYMWGTEEREEIDKKLYELRHERMEGDLDLLQETLKNQNELIASLEEGTIAYEEAIKERTYLEELYKEAQLANSESWIDRRDTFGRERGLSEELAEAIRVQQRYAKGTDERLEWDKKVYNLEKEIYDAQEQYTKDCEDLERERADKRIELEEEYADKVQDINDQLEQDIQDLNDEYTDALESRTKSLYDSYSLFDGVSKKDDVKASKLMRNLQDQVAYFEDWDDLMKQLSSRGLDSALIEEIQEMGPSAYEEVKALNSMTDSQLSQYANLWADKHEEAKNRATDELEDMRISAESQISELRSVANEELTGAKDDLDKALEEMNADIDAQLEELKTNFYTEVGIIKTDTVGQFFEMDAEIKEILSSAGYNEVGRQMVDGLAEGVDSGKPKFIEEIVGLSSDALDAIKTALGIASPSKKFAEIGGYMGAGLNAGIRSCYGEVSDTSERMGLTAMDALRSTIGEIADIINGDIDCTPTIRPVLDMSGVSGGLNWMNGVFSASRSISLGAKISSANQNGNNSRITELISANAAANGKIADTIAGIKDDISNLVGKVSRLQVVMDTGRLVGEITPEMDRSLGNAAIMRRRGV